MGIFDKVKDYVNNTDQADAQGNNDSNMAPQPQPQVQEPVSQFPNYSNQQPDAAGRKVVNFRSGGRTPVVLKKVTNFAETQDVADALNDKRIVILNLESCAKADAVRVIDFLSGVAYANGGGIKPIAGRAYIITPESVPLTGDFTDDMDATKMSGNLFD